ncbi:Kelch repeat protein [Aspergillus melleus]|uniref:Kelch repeat protein n=1 Tax=Aspergillus melleus TaxID=138277 RepID=UPI001E8E7F98|nr:uncharacterized protein LDX57_011550 [Aspergillus melleus]KAH8433914.1 hypothetical protein LDX57_011550 [Aspergillus melleus]
MALPIWTKLLSHSSIQRSSQTLSVLGGNAYIYGGELKPREPVDSSVYCIPLNQNATPTTEKTITQLNPPKTPQPRVGAASTTLNNKIYIFSGRGGTAMAPIEENGSFWVFDTTTNIWEHVSPSDAGSNYPVGRSYHALTNDGHSTIFLHAGCPEQGRLNDFWSFDLRTRVWRELPAAPGAARGGTSIAFAKRMVFRMNGFDGKSEIGGAVDVFNIRTEAWESVSFAADGVSGPAPRSVSCLVAVGGKLITMFGEGNPSALGHQGAGKMFSDVWAFDVEERKWEEVRVEGDGPVARGWFDAEAVGDGVVVQGGLGENNERLGDLWKLRLDF